MQEDPSKAHKKFPARLHVLIARNAPNALVLRRGPATDVCTFLWNRRDDTITKGQWLRKRIYERRCDLAPDGKHWIYFTMDGRWDGEARGAWTAVARAPWLKALALLPKGDCWQGGGLFLDNQHYWVNGGACHERRQHTREVSEDRQYTPAAWYGGECLTVYYNRLQRDGWILTSLQSKRHPQLLTVFEKALPKGWTLQKICNSGVHRRQGKGVYWDEHALVSDEGEFIPFAEWEWADWVDGHLVYAESGCLYRRRLLTARLLHDPELIHDFNPYRFEERIAPY
jgi:hypothetical protein